MSPAELLISEWEQAMQPLTEAQRQYARRLVLIGSDQARDEETCRELLTAAVRTAAGHSEAFAAHLVAAMGRITEGAA